MPTDSATGPVPCAIEGCTHPSRFIGDNPAQPEGHCECHSWNLTYQQLAGATTCHRDFPWDFGPTDSAAAPPFFRGAMGETEAADCDRIVGDDCCDERAVYFIEWKQRERDGGTIPVSGSCERHALDVDRNEVVRMRTHPGRTMGLARNV